MPQDKKANLVKLNRLPINPEQVGKLALKLHETQRRAYEGTQPIEDLFPILDDFNNRPKTDPQLHAARKTVAGLPDDNVKLRALTFIALYSREPADAIKAIALIKKLKTEEAITHFSSLYLELYPELAGAKEMREHADAFEVPANFGPACFWEEMRKAISKDARERRDSAIDCEESRHNTMVCADNYVEWLSQVGKMTTLPPHPLFDRKRLLLVQCGKKVAETDNATKTGNLLSNADAAKLDRLLADLSNDYDRAYGLCILGRLDDLRNGLRKNIQNYLDKNDRDFHRETPPEQVLNMLLAGSLLFQNTGEPKDLYLVCKILAAIGHLDTIHIVADPTFNNLAKIAAFHREFWPNLARGVRQKSEHFEQESGYGALLNAFFDKCSGIQPPDILTFFHPTNWLYLFLARNFSFRDELAQAEGHSELYDPEKYNLPRSQKITAYLQIAKWRGGGDDFAKDALERAYNHALDLKDSFYKVVLLCEIYALKMEYKLYR